jgi:hypothetical protein
MADENSPRAAAGQPPVIISGGTNPTVSPDPVEILSGGNGMCQFENQDPSQNYVLELWISNNSTRVPLCIFLPHGQSVVLITDPQVLNATVNYNVLVPGQANAPTKGGHGIIVGSGMGEKAA